MEERPGAKKPGSAGVIAFAHFSHDLYTAFLAPLLPLLMERLGLSLVQASLLDFIQRMPSLANPLLGALIDRRGWARWAVIGTPTTTAATMCLLGLAPGFTFAMILLFMTGVSVAALHVSAPVMISRLAGDRVGRGMGWFMFAGELARTVGPVMAVQGALTFGLEGLWKMIPVGVMASAYIAWRLPQVDNAAPRVAQSLVRSLVSTWSRMRRTLLGVAGVLMARSFLAAAVTLFLPIFVLSRGGSLWLGTAALVIVEGAGAVGALLAGAASDHYGRRRVITIAVVVAPLAMLVFLVSDGLWAIPSLLVLGATTLATTPVLIAIVLEDGGDDRAAANGTFMMINFALRSVVALTVGVLGDALGLETAYVICALAAVAGVPFVALLPTHEKPPATAPAGNRK